MNETFVTKKIAPKEKFSEFCIISRKTLGILAMYITTIGECTEDLVAKLDEDYENARLENKVTITDTKLTFPSRYKKPDGTTVEIVLKPNAYEGDKEWFFYYVVTDVNDTQWTKESAPGKQLESFAYLGSWETLLADLAAKAIPEEWDFVGSNTASREKIILVQYLRHTFSRLLYEKKICIDSDEQFAAFNTGLVDRYYDDIYACFVPNIAGYENKWRFAGFCTAGVNSLGKQLVNTFNPLPAPAVYFKCKEDLLFDQAKPLHVDFKHIIIDNVHRLPLQFLYEQFYDASDARELVNNIRAATDKDELYLQLRNLLDNDNKLFLRVQNRLKDAVELSKKRARWNYKTAVPMYYARTNTMSFMLPLALIDDLAPDVALVVGLTQSGCYQGQTVLTLPQAYIDARLVCRLTENWLDPTKISVYSQNADDPDE